MKVREATDSDIPMIVSLHNAYHGDERRPQDWIWEYKGLMPNSSVFSVLDDDGRVVGTQGMIPIPLIIKGKRYLSGKSENSLLSPKYRGGTSFKELYGFAISRCREKCIYLVWGFTPATRVWREKLKFHVYKNSMSENVLVLQPRNFLSDLLRSERLVTRKLAYSLEAVYLYLLSRLYELRSQKETRIRAFSIEKRLRSINDVRQLYGRLREKYPNLIHVDQSPEYLRWRVLGNPNIKYNTCFLYEGNRLKAYCYITTNDRASCLTDFTAEDEEAGTILAGSIIKKLRQKSSHVFILGNESNPLMTSTMKILRKFGFVRRILFRMPFVLRNLSYKDERSLIEIRNWYLNALWTEGYTI